MKMASASSCVHRVGQLSLAALHKDCADRQQACLQSHAGKGDLSAHMLGDTTMHGSRQVSWQGCNIRYKRASRHTPRQEMHDLLQGGHR